jgi:hypothetical protein
MSGRSVQVVRGKERLHALMEGAALGDVGAAAAWDAIFDGVLGDRAKVSDESRLPQTGMPASLEKELSSIFVEPFQLQVRSPVLAT